GIARLYDGGSDDQAGPYLVMELVEGTSILDYASDQQLGLAERLRLFIPVLEAVHYAHRNLVVHRDLKPANILVGDNLEVRAIGFGMAKFREHNLCARNRAMVGTYPWMAPEILIQGERITDAKVDIYALGHIFYELATGQHFWVRKGWGLNGFEKFVREYLQVSPMPTEAIDLKDFREGFYPNSIDLLARTIKISPKERIGSIDEILSRLGYSSYQAPAIEDLHLRYPLLVVESGSNKGAKTMVNVSQGNRVVLGRFELAGNDLSISRKHLEISRSGDRYFVRDLGSRNGTLLRGNILTAEDPPVEIKHCDRIKVGDIFLRFVFLRNF
ncbi:MAG: protein kinase, partial [Prochloraceae cyanobacterium]